MHFIQCKSHCLKLRKMKFWSMICLLVMLMHLLLSSCENFNYSHYQFSNDGGYNNLNNKNILDIEETVSDTTILALIGDSQRFYHSTSNVIDKINNVKNIDFVIHSGDLVDFGIQKEYIWMHQLLLNLNYPYIAVVGNHDLIGNGGYIYQHMYGKYNYSFYFKRNKYIYINTNSREFNFSDNVPDIGWLDTELSDTSSYNNAIVVTHVSYTHHSDFNPELKNDFEEVLRKYKKVLLVVNGHNHHFSYRYNKVDNIHHIGTFSTSKEKFVLVKIWKSALSYEIIE